MKNKITKALNGATCQFPRKHEAIQALLGLAWKKGKKERPEWLVKELNGYSQDI